MTWGPLSLVKPSDNETLLGDYSLQSGSAAIDHIPSNSTTYPTTTIPSLKLDFYGNPRPESATSKTFDPFMGKMRVKSTPQVGKTYWVGFSNPGRVVKPGDRVTVVIGKFYADALVVQ